MINSGSHQLTKQKYAHSERYMFNRNLISIYLKARVLKGIFFFCCYLTGKKKRKTMALYLGTQLIFLCSSYLQIFNMSFNKFFGIFLYAICTFNIVFKLSYPCQVIERFGGSRDCFSVCS